MKVLLVEDDVRTAGYLRKGFAENGFLVDEADDGDAGLALARGVADVEFLDTRAPHSVDYVG